MSVKTAAIVAGLVLCAPGAQAAQRTYLSDVTGADCTSDQSFKLRATMSTNAPSVMTVPDRTGVHILGGKQVGPFKAFPDTDADSANLWFHIKVKGKVGWVQSTAIICGD